MRFTAEQVAFLSNLTKADLIRALDNTGYTQEEDDFWDEQFVGISDNGNNFVYRIKFDSDDREGDEGFLYIWEEDGQLQAEF